MLGINSIKLATAVALIAVLTQVGMAQTINQRLHNQHVRIHNGYKDRQLNKYQRGALRAKDRQVRSEERYDRLTDHGKLTQRERAGLNRQLNRNSRRIYNDRHNK